MIRKTFSKRHFGLPGSLAILAVVATSGCGVQEARGPSSWAMDADGSVTDTMPTAAYGGVPQDTGDQQPRVYESVTYDDAVSKFGMKADKDAFGAYAGEGLIGFRFGLSGIFLGMSGGVPSDDQEVVVDVLANEGS